MEYRYCLFLNQVIAGVADKAAANQRFIDMHGGSQTANIFAGEERDIFFLSDAPHLLKTIRNNLASSGSGLNTRLLWVCLQKKESFHNHLK